MVKVPTTLYAKNLMGNTAIGAVLVVFGMVDMLVGVTNLLAGVLVLMLGAIVAVSVYMELSKRSESDDEQSSSNMDRAGWASCNLAAMVLLALFAVSFNTDGEIRIRTAVCLVAGLLLVVQGTVYAALSRKDKDGFDD